MLQTRPLRPEVSHADSALARRNVRFSRGVRAARIVAHRRRSPGLLANGGWAPRSALNNPFLEAFQYIARAAGKDLEPIALVSLLVGIQRETHTRSCRSRRCNATYFVVS
jgi:hypothetical protein